ncbi:hypothetical protein [Achromobacter sp. AGC25]
MASTADRAAAPNEKGRGFRRGLTATATSLLRQQLLYYDSNCFTATAPLYCNCNFYIDFSFDFELQQQLPVLQQLLLLLLLLRLPLYPKKPAPSHDAA